MGTSFAHCPDCDCWVPASEMYMEIVHEEGETNPNGLVVRACSWCIDGMPTPDKYKYPGQRTKAQCVFCDSFDVELLEGGNYLCHTCEEVFIL